jgi:hypothetical protein
MEHMSVQPASPHSDPPELWSAGPEVLAEIVALEQERARLDARSARLLARLDADQLYQLDGAATARSWLKAHTAMAAGTAASRLKLARQLRDLPVIADQLRAGHLAADQVRILLCGHRPSTSAAFVADQDTLVAAAAAVHIDDLPRVVRVWLAHTDPDGTDPHDGRQDQEVHLHQVLDGPFALTGTLDARGGQELAGALQRAMADLRPGQHADGRPMTPAQRRAEALVELARHYLGRNAPSTGMGGPARGSQPRITVLTNPTDLSLGLGARCRDGTWLNGEQVRQLLCDATVQAALTDATGNLLRTYASARFPTATLRNSVMARDRRCRFHGCDRPASVCDVHHVVHDEHGGRTEPGNLVLLCGRHHALLHRGWSASMTADGQLEIRRPSGTMLAPTSRWGPDDTG